MSVVYSYAETEFEISATALIKRTRQVYSCVLPSSMTRVDVELKFQPLLLVEAKKDRLKGDLPVRAD